MLIVEKEIENKNSRIQILQSCFVSLKLTKELPLSSKRKSHEDCTYFDV